jgi:uncharacterized protein with PQ loop repeat
MCRKMIPDAFAYIGGSILATQMLPQLRKIHRRESAKDISYLFLAMNMIGLSLMTTYSFLINDMPLIVTTSLSMFNTVICVGMKIYYDEFKRDVLIQHSIEECNR